MHENENPDIRTTAGSEVRGKTDAAIAANGRWDTRQIWQAAMRDLSLQFNRAEFESWIKNLELIGIDQGVATLVAPNSNAKRRLDLHYGSQIRRAIAGVVGEPVTVNFVVEQPVQHNMFETATTNRNGNNNAFSKPANGHYGNGQNRPSNWPNGNSVYPTNQGSAPYNIHEDDADFDDVITNPDLAYNGKLDPDEIRSRMFGLNPKYKFDSYVPGSSNRLAVAAARNVAENPGFSYNPLFIYGSVGLGKTHILHAIGHEALKLRPHLNVLYVSSEKFTNDLVHTLREQRSMEEFRNRYRSIDILMIDDIQFISGKESTQEEFFHTFNHLYNQNKQIIISSDRHPRATIELQDRLRSRFEGGLITDVQLPDYEMRLAILSKKNEVLAVRLPDSVLEHIAKNVASNIRELEGALTRVMAYALTLRAAPTIDLANEALAEIMQDSRKKTPDPDRIIDTVCQFFSVDVKELKGRGRSSDIVLPRQVAMYLIREQTETSLVDIGHRLGGRDHTTVMYAVSKIETEIENNVSLRQQINTIVQILYTEGGTGR